MNILILALVLAILYYVDKISNKIFYGGLALFFAYWVIQQFYCTNRVENFDAILGDKKRGIVRRVDLNDFFNFVEWFQVGDLDPKGTLFNTQTDNQLASYDQKLPMMDAQGASCVIDGDAIIIRNSIRNVLDTLHYIVNVNDKDNFYSRFLVTKVGSNLQFDRDHPRRFKLNYEEMVYNRISPQFTITPQKPNEIWRATELLDQNAFDLYLPRPSTGSMNQNPVPLTINLHNYYNLKNTEVNLLALKMLFDLIQDDNPELFSNIIRPTEHPAFQQEFLVPLRSVINSMLEITILSMILYVKTYTTDQMSKKKQCNKN
jgi:hypothetical protein